MIADWRTFSLGSDGLIVTVTFTSHAKSLRTRIGKSADLLIRFTVSEGTSDTRERRFDTFALNWDARVTCSSALIDALTVGKISSWRLALTAFGSDVESAKDFSCASASPSVVNAALVSADS